MVLVRVLRRFSLAVVLALAAGYLIPTGAGLAFAAEPPGVLPPAVSPVPVTTPPVVPVGDFSRMAAAPVEDVSASGRAGRVAVRRVPTGAGESSFDEATSVVSARTMFSTEYRNADGTHSTELSVVPLNVRTDAGIWVPVSTAVLRSAEGGRVVDHPLSPSFAPRAGSSSLYSISDGIYSVSFGLVDSASSELSTSMARRTTEGANRAQFRDVFPGTDIRFDVLPGQVKETLVLGAVPTVSSWTWTIRAPGLALVKNQYG